LNIEKGIKRFDGDKEVYYDILRSFAVNTQPVIEKITTVSEADLGDYAIIVHGIKGSSRSIGADKISDMAEALEMEAKAGNCGFIAENNPAFIEEALKLLSGIKGILPQTVADEEKPSKDKPDKTVLDRLAEACGNYDMDEMDAAIAELERYNYKTGGELLAWLRENIEALNFSKIAEKLSHSD
jgi:HPt (histidine-containing phosphotransfer) domain-containing protein